MQESSALRETPVTERAARDDLENVLLEIRREAKSKLGASELWPRYFDIRHLDFLALLRSVPLTRCSRILEIGCGIGYFTAFLSTLADEVIAVDLVDADQETHSPGLRLADDFLKSLDIDNVTLFGASAEQLPFADGSFDLVISNHVLEHVPDRPQAVREMHRVLSLEGKNVCVVPTRAERVFFFPWYYAYLAKRALVHTGRWFARAEASSGQSSAGGSPSGTSMLDEFPWPPTHGAFRNYLDELRSWSCARWRQLVTGDGEHELLSQSSTLLLPFPLIDILSRLIAVGFHRHSLNAQVSLGRFAVVRNAGLNTVVVTRRRETKPSPPISVASRSKQATQAANGSTTSAKKILHFLERSGTSRYYDKLFRHFEKHSRNEFHVATIRPAEAFFAQIRTHVSETSSLGSLSRYYTALGKMISLLRRTKPDLVHAHELIPAFYAALALLLSFSSAKLVYHRHHNHTLGLKLKLFDLVASFRATKIVAVSEAMSAIAVLEHPCARNKVTFLHNGIDVENDTDRRGAPSLPKRGARILLLARLRPEKGHQVALNAIERVKEQFAETTLAFAGTGALESELRQEVASRNLTKTVLFLGHVEDIAGLLRQVDMVIMPSLSEPFGLVAIEAMAAKRLVIASRVGGLREIVEHGQSGVLVEPSQPDELAAQISYYLEHPDERRRLAENGHRRYLERFTSEKMARNYLALYEELLGVA